MKLYNNFGDDMKNVVEKLKNLNKTISTMESCTGGLVVNEITNIEGASEVISFSAVTYSNEFKIKMGVDKDIIDEYSVYSIETAKEMSKNICIFANSNYGVGITGKLNRVDKNNLVGIDNKVFISIYDRDNNLFYNYDLEVTKNTRKENKELVLELVIEKLKEIIK